MLGVERGQLRQGGVVQDKETIMIAIPIVSNSKDGRVLVDHLTKLLAVQQGRLSQEEQIFYLGLCTASQQHSQG